MNSTHAATLVLPTQATTGAFSSDGKHLAVGSDDGSVRLYYPPEPKVRKAIRSLGASISSVLFHDSDEDNIDIWVASGRTVFRFNLELTSDRMILTRSDASFAKGIGQDDEDVVNQLALSTNHAYLACTTDSGDVYVLDISSSSHEVLKMKMSHNSIAWTASFITDRPSELLTGGYDCTLVLHDFKLRTILAQFEITPAPALAPGISSLPPFITALALSSHGAVAAGTADGRIWIGLGGVKSSTGGKKGKRSKKWGGLNEEEGFFTKIGENMIAGLQFITSDTLLSCTVHGRLVLHQLTRNLRSNASRTADLHPGGLQALWTVQSACAKVDVLAYTAQSQTDGEGMASTFAVAGLHADKKRGAVELWELRRSDPGEPAEKNKKEGGEEEDKQNEAVGQE